MSYNKIISRTTLGSVSTSSGKRIVISAATKTSSWVRPEFAAELLRKPLEKAVVANESVLPSNTAEVIAREGDHESDSDTRSHITAVCYNGRGDFIQTVHLATKK